MNPVPIVFEWHYFTVDYIALPAAEFQAPERTTVAVDGGEITRNEKSRLLAFPASHPHQHAMPSGLP
ncbi:hypothetical protein [Phyllobacterium lublinensis]|uniref:hypothetical protein n=1 Tax=Phyllobacterium lublinensis TaxID=2875708 RepID=UPI001CCDDDC5|nr:hypothetical protein [Phyllobacterium sp. 2063]MBZ9656600.1 hypothetical protein [Phyllobacterium sp. 2063]